MQLWLHPKAYELFSSVKFLLSQLRRLIMRLHSSTEVKSISDVIVTSSNAKQIVNAIPMDRADFSCEFIGRVFQYLKLNPDKANQQGLDAIRENLNFYNRKDFRLETTLNLFDRWEVTTGDIMDKDLKIISELPPLLIDQKRISERLKNSQMNLLKLIQWVKTSECRALEIYKYFGFEDIKKCGVCDNCKAQA